MTIGGTLALHQGGDETPPPPEEQRWELRRNCRLRPVQLAGLCALPCALSLLVALCFSALGYPLFLAFAGLECLAVAITFIVYARHAADCATITLQGPELQVQQQRGSQVHTLRLPCHWLRVHTTPTGLALRSGQTTVELNGYAPRAVCAAVQQGLQQALRRQR